jgi:hypothetical protein
VGKQQAALVQPAALAPDHAPAAPEQVAAAAAAAAAAPEAAVEQLLHERQALIAEARRRKATAQEKFAKLSQVCVAADQVREQLCGGVLAPLRLSQQLESTD